MAFQKKIEKRGFWGFQKVGPRLKFDLVLRDFASIFGKYRAKKKSLHLRIKSNQKSCISFNLNFRKYLPIISCLDPNPNLIVKEHASYVWMILQENSVWISLLSIYQRGVVLSIDISGIN